MLQLSGGGEKSTFRYVISEMWLSSRRCKKTKVFVSSKFNMAQESNVAPNMPHTIFTEF